MSKAISIENFSYIYPDGTAALDKVSLEIEHGQKVVLIGPNGAGKSTLLQVMAGFIKGTGEVLVDGLAVNKKNIKQIRRRLVSCLESPDEQLFMPTLFDDVAFGPLNMGLSGDEVKERVTKTLEKVGLGGMADKPPHHLSAGQKRSAALATVLSMEPEIITMDEPDGSLDPRNRRQLVGMLNDLSQTLVVATCNMHFAVAVAQRAIVIDQGRVMADGPAREIVSDSEMMERHGLENPYTD